MFLFLFSLQDNRAYIDGDIQYLHFKIFFYQMFRYFPGFFEVKKRKSIVMAKVNLFIILQNIPRLYTKSKITDKFFVSKIPKFRCISPTTTRDTFQFIQNFQEFHSVNALRHVRWFHHCYFNSRHFIFEKFSS